METPSKEKPPRSVPLALVLLPEKIRREKRFRLGTSSADLDHSPMSCTINARKLYATGARVNMASIPTLS